MTSPAATVAARASAAPENDTGAKCAGVQPMREPTDARHQLPRLQRHHAPYAGVHILRGAVVNGGDRRMVL